MSIRGLFRSLSKSSKASSPSSSANGTTASSSSSSSSKPRPSLGSIFSSAPSTTSSSSPSGKLITLEGAAEFQEVSCDESKEILVMGSLKAPLFEAEQQEKRAPIDLCCVIDESGSMEGEKIALARKAMEFVVDNLDKDDTLAIVVYDSNVSTLIPFTKMDPNGKKHAKTLIAKMTDKGSTNLSGGLFQGIQLSKDRKAPNEICSVLLLTDGQANVGISDTPTITAQLESQLQSFSKKPTVFTFGFGADHNQDMLRGIAESGGGMYYYLADADKIPLSFADCLGGLQSVVGQNLALEVLGASGVKIVKSLNTKYKITKGTPLPSSKIVLELGDIYSEEGRDIIFLVSLPKSEESAQEGECVKFRLSYFNVLTAQDEVAEASATVKRSKKVSGNQKANPQLDIQRNRLQAAEAMEESKKLADKGDLTKAKSVIQKAKETIQASSTAQVDFSAKLMTELDQCTEDLRDINQYKAEGSKKFARKAQAHYYQRSNKLESKEISFYETSAKVASKSKLGY